MDTTSLFNFEFVDRYKEKKIFNTYAKNTDNHKILWISGKRGIGKSRFVKQMMQDVSNSVLIWLDNSIQDENGDLIIQFLDRLKEYSGEDFFDFVVNNYKEILNVSKDIIKNYIFDKNYFLSHITDFLFHATSEYIDTKAASREMYKLFEKYLSKISLAKSLYIVLDNFSRFDKKNAQFFVDLICKNIESDSVKFCIITTDEDIITNSELENKIFMSIPFQSIHIQEFPSYVFFAEILYRIFGDNSFKRNDIEYIFEKCEGNPENLVKLIKKCWKRDAIIFSNNSFVVQKEKLYSILRIDSTRFTLDDFTFREQLLLLVIICIGKTINVEFLKKAIDYLNSKIFIYKQFSDELFFETLGSLINNNIITYGLNNLLLFEHDSTYLDISDILFELKLKPQICFNMYELIMSLDLTAYGYSDEDYRYYKAFYAAEAMFPGWEKINFDYACYLSNKQRFQASAAILDKIPVSYFINDFNNLLFIGQTYYENGQYNTAYQYLTRIKEKEIQDPNFLFNYYFFLGKVENIIQKKSDAIIHLKKALKTVIKENHNYIETLNLLHLTYMEIDNGKKKAFAIFEYVRKNYETTFPLEWAKTIRGVANFYDGDFALSLLDRALSIVTLAKNKIEIAYIENTLGFINLRLGNIIEAEHKFNNSIHNLKTTKIHEMSYALNNRAICRLLSGDYENALKDLLDALLWNASPYAYYTINCHLCMCYSLLNQKEDAHRIINILEKYLFSQNIVDPVVARKINMTLGITHYHLNERIIGKTFFSKIDESEILNTSSEYRYFAYTNQLDRISNPVHNTTYYKNLDIEPWILIFGHD